MGEQVTIREAAQRLGVSEDTVRRRLRRGELTGVQQPTAQGFTWLVELPEVAPAGPSAPEGAAGVAEAVAAAEVRRLEELVAILREELDARRREVQELHILLQRAQTPALPPPPTAAPGGPAPPVQSAPAPPRRTPRPLRWWRRLLRPLGG